MLLIEGPSASPPVAWPHFPNTLTIVRRFVARGFLCSFSRNVMRVSLTDVPARIETFVCESVRVLLHAGTEPTRNETEGVQGDHFVLVSPVASMSLMLRSVESFHNEFTDGNAY
jgi:hypothetical protein